MSAQVDLKLTGPMDHLRIVWQTGETLIESVPFREDPEATRYHVLLAVQEMITNVLRHAYDMNEERPVHVTFRVTEDHVEVEVRDQGKKFDPTEHDTSQLGHDAAMPADSGGYGIYIAKLVMDEISYTRSGNWNVLRMSKFAGVPAGAVQGGHRENA